MGLNACVCPTGVLETITDPDGCKSNKKSKIARMVFQVIDDTNVFVDAVNGIEEAASWTGLADAVDSTKIVTTPYLLDVTFGETEVNEGSENLDGATTADGVNAQLVEAMIENINPENAAAINSLGCVGNLGVYFIYNDNSIVANKIAATPTYQAIRISPDTFSGSAPSREGTGASPNWKYKLSFKLPAEWYETAIATSAEAGFNYKTDLLPS